MQRLSTPLKMLTPSRLFSPSYFMMSLLISLFALASCDGGGGSNNRAEPTGTASGKLTVPPDNTVEVEPNDDIPQAQAASDSLTVSGNTSETDPHIFFIPTPDGDLPIPDLFSVNTSEPIRITLSIGANNLEVNDLDLVLIDASEETIVDASAGLISTELIEITPDLIDTTGGDFLVGIVAFAGRSAYVIDFASVEGLSTASEPIPPGAEFVPGEVLVKLKEGGPGRRQKGTNVAALYGLAQKQSFPQGVELMQVTPPAPRLQKGATGSKSKFKTEKSEANELKALTIDTIQRLRRDPDIVYAEANFIRKPFLTPNDTHFPKQWHYELINLPQAWEMTIGSNDVVVAVIDTGVWRDKTNPNPDPNILSDHPELQPRLIPGYDFISDPENADDGDGIDPIATDVGNDPRGVSSSFHGTHVAGTIGAATNNGTGVAGVTWETRIMPLRVLGSRGGTDADIAQAILYASGLPNNSGTLPTEPARIINMSLGGPGFSQTVQNVINNARDAGVIVVAAAGNESTSAPSFPAAYNGVISVSAVDLNSRLAPYSNFGRTIDVAAPGGNITVDIDGDGYKDGVLSTLGNDEGEFGFGFLPGTSMAAPHVAGVLALMLAENPNLIPADIDQLLAGTHPNTPQRITRDLGATGRDDLYGHGLIDAALAVQAASAVQGGGTPPTTPILSVSTTSLDFNNYINTLQININNIGIGTLTVTEITDDAPWLTVTPTSGTAPLTVIAAVDRTGLADGNYPATITITSDAPQNPAATVTVQMTVGGATSGNVGTVFVLLVDEAFNTVAETETSLAQNYTFTVPNAPAGTYTIVAGTDRDDDGVICDIEDACGSFPDPVTVTPGEDRPGIEILVGDLASPQRAKAAPGGTPGKKFRRLQ